MFTVDANKIWAVKKLVDKVIERGDRPPYITYYFIRQGMMERVGANIIYQHFYWGNSLTGTGVCVIVSTAILLSVILATISVSGYQFEQLFL